MKKLYRKGTVHPSPPPTPIISDKLLSFLPATILTLTVALSPEEREVLAYLISSSSANPRKGTVAVVDGHDHPPLFHCTCFRCYMSYWVRWDSSPNHQLIHQIIDAFEDDSLPSSQTTTTTTRNNKRGSKTKSHHLKPPSSSSSQHSDSDQPQPVRGESSSSSDSNSNSGVVVHEAGDGVEDDQKGSVRRFVSFIGESIWGAWGQ